jgi:hypothetical protein
MGATHLVDYLKTPGQSALGFSVSNRPKFLPQNTKVAQEKSQRPRKSPAEFYAEFPKNGRKGAEPLEVCFPLKILDNLQNLTLKSQESRLI